MDWAFGNPVRNLILTDGPIKNMWNPELSWLALIDKEAASEMCNAAEKASLASGAVWLGKDMAPVEYQYVLHPTPFRR
jgi:hypothetical protein